MTSVEDADLSDVIAGRPEDLALRVLTVLCSSLSGRTLTSIDVSDNAMGEKGINACKAVLAGQPALQSLRMCNDGLSASAMEAMRDLLLEGATGAEGEESSSGTGTQLRKLHFFNNMSGDGGAKVSMLWSCQHNKALHRESRKLVWQLRALALIAPSSSTCWTRLSAMLASTLCSIKLPVHASTAAEQQSLALCVAPTKLTLGLINRHLHYYTKTHRITCTHCRL
jgi:hypothetical protein